MVPVKFLVKNPPYMAGEVAGFIDSEAAKLVEAGVATYYDPSEVPEGSEADPFPTSPPVSPVTPTQTPSHATATNAFSGDVQAGMVPPFVQSETAPGRVEPGFQRRERTGENQGQADLDHPDADIPGNDPGNTSLAEAHLGMLDKDTGDDLIDDPVERARFEAGNEPAGTGSLFSGSGEGLEGLSTRPKPDGQDD